MHVPMSRRGAVQYAQERVNTESDRSLVWREIARREQVLPNLRAGGIPTPRLGWVWTLACDTVCRPDAALRLVPPSGTGGYFSLAEFMLGEGYGMSM